MQKITLFSFLVLLLGITNNQVLFAQSWWHQSTFETSLQKETQNEMIFEIDQRMLENSFKNSPLQFSSKKEKLLMEFPDGESGSKVYAVWRTEVLHPRLQEKYKNVVSFAGQAIDNPKELIRFTYYPKTGVKANISIPGKKSWIIEPIKGNMHRMFSSGAHKHSDFECQLEEKVAKKIVTGFAAKNVNDSNLRRYRLALSVSGDYSQFFLDGSEADDTERKEKVMAAMVNTMNRVNGIFERDFSVTMQIIPENESLIFLDPNTDPYTSGGFNGQLQNTLDQDPNVGSGAYDVGHLFHHEGSVYGNAGCIACVCTDGEKGSAFTVHSDPSSDNFSMIVAHEFGHQFGGYHVQSSPTCRSGNNSEVEPGSGSTIMGYAGICNPNVQQEPDDYFNYVDIRDVAIWTIQNSNCAEVIDTGNQPPVVDAGNDYVIPRSTPFVLEGAASDADDDMLTYCWEQNDPENPGTTDTPQPTWTQGPLFRSRLPVDTPVRYMPRLEDVLQGNLTPTWEVLPSVSRNMQFEFTVRDNFVGGGQTNTDTMNVEVDDNAGPFVVTSQNTTEIWNAGEEVTVTWDVANTNTAPINATTVDILLSVDGGYTYPYVLQDDIANDGEASFFLENVVGTSEARIMVRASDNIFFALNSTNFEVVISDFVITSTNSNISVCSNETVAYTLDYKTFLDFEEEVSFSIQNLPDGIVANFSPLSISESHIDGTPVNLTLSNTEALEVGQYEFIVKGTSLSGIEKNLGLSFNVFQSGIPQSTLLFPVDGQNGVDIEGKLEWSSNENVDHYRVEVAIDENFNNVIESFETSTTSYETEQLNYNSVYFWRVRSINPCEEITSEVFSFSTACAAPVFPEYDAVGATYIHINWEDDISTNWDVQFGASGFTLGEGTIVNVNEKKYEASSLESLTSYDFYVRSTCSIGETGIWIGPLTISTTKNYCAGDRFYDSGGANGPYQDNEIITTVISPESPEDRVRVVFESFEVEQGFDYLSIYDGPNDSSPLLGNFTGQSNIGAFRSNHESGSLTFVFTSDYSVQGSGWDARVFCEPKPNCLAPNNFAVEMIESNAVDMVWENSDDASSWEIEYGFSGFVLGEGAVVTSDDVNYRLEGLNASTEYDIYIKANCTIGGVSDVIGPYEFKTLCGAFDAPFLESFTERYALPDCWEMSGDEDWNFSLGADYDAYSAGDRNPSDTTNYAWIDGDYPSGSDHTSVLTTPLIDVTALSNPSVQFSVFSKNERDNTYNSLLVELYDGADWNTVLEFQENTYGWMDIVVDLQDYTITGAIQVRFSVTEDSPGTSYYNDILIDEFKVDEMPSCPSPRLLTTTEVRGRTASIDWTSQGSESNWELQYGREGFSPRDGITEFVTSTSYTIENLEPETNYEVYVRAVCAIGDSSEFIDPLEFRTTCDVFTAPYAEEFYSYRFPNCWDTEINNAWRSDTYYDNVLGENIPDRTIGNSTRYMFKNNDSDRASGYLLTPYVNLSELTNPSLQFSLYSNEVSDNMYNILTIEVLADDIWNEEFVFEQATQGWQDFYIDLSGYAGKEIQVRFHISEDRGDDEYNFILIDDVKFDELPSCSTPYAIEYSDLTNDSIILSWLSDGTETTWEIEYGYDGFTPGFGNGTTVTADTNLNFAIYDLEGDTTYDLYIRSICGEGSYSNFMLPINFRTDCDPFITPYEENFNSYGIPQCWENSENNVWVSDTYYDSQTGRYVPDRTIGYNRNYLFVRYDSTTEDYLYTPFFDLQNLANPSLQFSLYSNEISNQEYSELSIEVFNGTSWEEVFAFAESTQGWQDFYIDLTSYIASEVQFRFSTNRNQDSSEFSYILLDDIKVDETPNCSTPYNINIQNVTNDTLILSWDSDGTETSWEVVCGYEGFSPNQGTEIIAIANTNDNFDFSGLYAETNYSVYVRSICEDGSYSNYTGPIDFRTLCDPLVAPFEENFVVYGIPNCWSTGFWNSGGDIFDDRTNQQVPDYTEGGNTRYVFKNDNGSQNQISYLTLPLIDVSQLNVPAIQFAYYNTQDFNDEYETLHVEVFNGTSWEEVFTATGETIGWKEVSIDISNYADNDLVQIRFGVSQIGYNDNYILLDDIGVTELPTCFKPRGLTADTITQTTADISWTPRGTETAWEVEYGFEGFALGEGTRISVTDDEYILTNLFSGTSYDVYVRAVCDINDISEWSRSFQFMTNPDYCSGNRFYDSGGANGDYSNNENEITTIYPSEFSDYVRVNFLSFYLESCCDALYIYDGPDISSPLIGEYRGTSPGEVVSTHTTGALTFRFTSDHSVVGSGWEAEVICESYCDAPQNVTISDIYDTSATVSWDNMNINGVWEVEYGTAGFTVGSGMSNETSDNFFNIEGLVSGEYEVYVKTLCSDDTESYNVGPIPFTIQGILDTPEVNLNNEIEITPNPNKGVFMISYGGAQVLDQIQVFDFTGRLVFDKDLSTFNKTEEISLSNPEAGIYLVQIIAAEKIITKKILVE